MDERASDPKKARSTPKAKSTDPSKKKKHLKQVPIIIVPSGMYVVVLLSLHNRFRIPLSHPYCSASPPGGPGACRCYAE